MGLIILIAGVALWWAAHLWKRAAPDQRAGFGDGGKGIVTGLLALSVLLMIWGYRISDGPFWWGRTAATTGINNLMVLAAVYLFAASGIKTRLGTRLRHPQLLGFSLWAAGHLLVNGDLPSLVLFGGLLAWALAEMTLLSRTPWTRPRAAPAPMRKEVMAAAGAVLVFGILGLIHGWIGPTPFGA